MASSIQHRGPDDEGILVARGDRVGLANRRLAIRDLSPAGHMPMSTEDGQVAITHKGEIYNAGALRSQLAALGHQFNSTSDTEILLRAYVEWGIGAVTCLLGMFAFALLDTRQGRERLYLARDHMGVKPLYYSLANDGFLVFASELRAIRASCLVSSEICPAGLVGYLQTGSVPNPFTIYKDVWRLWDNISTGRLPRNALAGSAKNTRQHVLAAFHSEQAPSPSEMVGSFHSSCKACECG